jgi:hypothetical protein
MALPKSVEPQEFRADDALAAAFMKFLLADRRRAGPF